MSNKEIKVCQFESNLISRADDGYRSLGIGGCSDWTTICNQCVDKIIKDEGFNILPESIIDRLDENGYGYCMIKGCKHNTENENYNELNDVKMYYYDFE